MTPATFTLRSTGERTVEFAYKEPEWIDVLYYTQKEISQREFEQIKELIQTWSSEVNRILSLYI